MKFKVIFAREFYESFTGTQEELDAIVEEIQSLADSGKLIERSIPMDFDSDIDDDDEDSPPLSEVVKH
jgi:hypothetical protein